MSALLPEEIRQTKIARCEERIKYTSAQKNPNPNEIKRMEEYLAVLNKSPCYEDEVMAKMKENMTAAQAELDAISQR